MIQRSEGRSERFFLQQVSIRALYTTTGQLQQISPYDKKYSKSINNRFVFADTINTIVNAVNRYKY